MSITSNLQPESPGKDKHVTNTALKRQLSLWDAVMLNMGSMIGSGIFFVPAAIAQYLHFSLLYLGVWVAGGLISMLGALSIAELGAAMPRAGGQYVYLRAAYGPLCGFLSGWASFAVIMTASIAAVAVACAQCLTVFFPLNTGQIKIIALASIWLLTLINMYGAKTGTRVQNVFTVLKIGSLIAIIFLGFFLSGGHLGNFTPALPDHSWGVGLWSSMGLALVGVLWAFDGWIQVTYVAGEVIAPQRNLPKALLISTLGVVILYGVINVIYIYLLSMHGMATHPIAASETLRLLVGDWGKTLISIAILVSTFGANNGFIFSGARIYYAMASDGAFFPAVARLTPAGIPMVSLVIQGIWASLLVFTGSFEQLFTYVIFAAWLFYAMACGAVFILRYKRPEMERPYKTWGYPWAPAIFVFFALGLVLNTILSAPRESLIGLGIILLGLPAYFYCHRRVPKTD